MRWSIMAAGLALAGGAAHAAPVTRIAAPPARPGWFVCDAIEGSTAALVGRQAAGRSVITLIDRRTGRLDTQSYNVGAGDPGAGNIYWPLSQGGREIGYLRGINPGMVAGSDGIPPMTEVKIGDRTLSCRWLANLRFIGLDARRGVTVTQDGGKLVYRSFDLKGRGPVLTMDEGQRSNAPTLTIAGGREERGGFTFVNHGFTYRVEPGAGDGGAVIVSQGRRQVGIDRLVGSTYLAGGRLRPGGVER